MSRVCGSAFGTPADAGLCDYAIGVGPSELWFGVPATARVLRLLCRNRDHGPHPAQCRPGAALRPDHPCLPASELAPGAQRKHDLSRRDARCGGSDTTGDGSAANPWADDPISRSPGFSRISISAGFTVTIAVADGTYTDPILLAGAPMGATGPGQIVILGNSRGQHRRLVPCHRQRLHRCRRPGPRSGSRISPCNRPPRAAPGATRSAPRMAASS